MQSPKQPVYELALNPFRSANHATESADAAAAGRQHRPGHSYYRAAGNDPQAARQNRPELSSAFPHQ